MKIIQVMLLSLMFSKNIFAQNLGINNLDPQAALDLKGDLRLRTATLNLPQGISHNVDLTTNKAVNYNFDGGSLNGAIISGFTGGVDGRIITIFNNGASAIQLYNEAAGSVEQNRILTGSGNPAVIFQNGTISMRYDGQKFRWTVVSSHFTDGLNSSFWQKNGLAGNEIKNTNSGGFWSQNSIGLTFISNDTSNPPTAPITGEGTRLMWIPSRSAFRVGTIDQWGSTKWDAANIGLFSFASGLDSYAKGIISTAFGTSNAIGDVSVAMGAGATANGYASIATGEYTTASGYASTAMGESTVASGINSTAIGYHTIASRLASTALGKYNMDNPNALFMVGNGNSTNRVTAFVVNGNTNYVGIGVDNPIAHLHVGNYGSVTGSQISLFSPGSTSFAVDNSFAVDVGIYANAGIVSGTFIGAAQNVVSSDIRIKNIINRSDNLADLDLLKKLQITNYRMKDKATWGDKIFKKVIAQEVEKIYPEAVSKQTSVIPDIYTLAEKVDYNANKNELIISLTKSYDLKVGEKIELVHPEKGKVRATITAVTSNSFTVKDWLYDIDKIFVFGREVDDFRVIDYEALSMLGISAIQQLAKENEVLRIKIDEQRMINVEQKIRNEKMEAHLNNIEARLNKLNIEQ